jgi:hypothetical protein
MWRITALNEFRQMFLDAQIPDTIRVHTYPPMLVFADGITRFVIAPDNCADIEAQMNLLLDIRTVRIMFLAEPRPAQKERPKKKPGQAVKTRTAGKNGQKPGQAVRVFLMADADHWNLSVRDIAKELNVSKSVVSSVRSQLLGEKGQLQ